jgi:hypothetical protein
MRRYSISEIWKEDPDFEALARAVLNLVLTLESDPSKSCLLDDPEHPSAVEEDAA